VARLDRRAALAAWRSYDGAPAGVRAFVGARLLLLPLCELEPELRALSGRVLSLGAGYGAVERYVAQVNDGVVIEGVELDASRVALADEHPVPRVAMRAGDALAAVPAGSEYDSALAIDLLHHIPAERHGDVLAAVARGLKPGGLFVFKDIARTPRWQHRWNALHDRLVAGPEPVHCHDPGELVGLALRSGFSSARWRRVGRYEPYPHYVVELRAAS
jgi:SAM-dependent methyltransferase